MRLDPGALNRFVLWNHASILAKQRKEMGVLANVKFLDRLLEKRCYRFVRFDLERFLHAVINHLDSEFLFDSGIHGLRPPLWANRVEPSERH